MSPDTVRVRIRNHTREALGTRRIRDATMPVIGTIANSPELRSSDECDPGTNDLESGCIRSRRVRSDTWESHPDRRAHNPWNHADRTDEFSIFEFIRLGFHLRIGIDFESGARDARRRTGHERSPLVDSISSLFSRCSHSSHGRGLSIPRCRRYSSIQVYATHPRNANAA